MDERYLEPTAVIDSDHDTIKAYAEKCIGTGREPVENAVALYNAVRDGIWYDPYVPFHDPDHYRASNVLKSGRGYCVSKASLLCALGRACRIPTRIGFATVRNHLATRQLIEYMGTDLFAYHGYTEFYLEGKWVQSTPAFNIELCRKHRVAPLEFNGREDSIFQPYNTEQKKFMEYVEYHGTFHDIPVDEIVAGWKRIYGEERVGSWIEMFEKAKGKPVRDFYKEEVVKL